MLMDYPYPPPAWTNQKLILYHGTLDVHIQSILNGVQVSKGQPDRDFGQGFYTTTVERQARSWAYRLVVQNLGTRPAVIRFEVNRDDLAKLECLSFVLGNFDAEDFWSFVFHCRNGGQTHNRPTEKRWYDVVMGPVTASWRQRLLLQDTDQVSFHTDEAAQVLNQSNPKVI